MQTNIETLTCPLEASLSIIGGKYKINIIFFLMSQTLRFSELQKKIPSATPKMLSQQLKELETDGLVNRVLYPVVPPKTEYSLTEKGKSLRPVILELYKWGEERFKEAGKPVPCRAEDVAKLADE